MTSDPSDDRVLAIVQAGGRGDRMDVLTRERAKPALAFAGSYRLIDFTLSSLVNSGISDVWVGVQYLASSLDTHLAGGRPWDLDRTRGGFRRVVPEEGAGTPERTGFSRGNADNLLRLADQISAFDADIVLVLSADHVVNVDLRRVLRLHRERSAEATLVTAQVTKAEAVHQAVVRVGRGGLVTDFAYKPENPSGHTVMTEIVAYHPQVLLTTLQEIHVDRSGGSRMDGRARREESAPPSEEGNGLGDFGDHLLPRLVERGATYAAEVDGYWLDVGRPETYWRAHQDLLAGRMDVFDDPARPIHTRFPERPPGLVAAGAGIANSLISPGAHVAGRVRDSVVGPDCVVRAGASVTGSILGQGVLVEGGAEVRTAIIDDSAVVGARARVGGGVRGRPTDDQITLVGRGSRIRRGAVVRRGARLEPGSTG